MKKLSLTKSMAVFGLAAICALGVVGCAGNDGKQSWTGGVAATVNGTEIQEDTITAAIEDIRQRMGLTDESAWGNWMAQNDYTPESVRTEILDSYIDQELVKQGASSMDISVDPAQVDEYVDTMRANYDSDEAWQDALESVGMTEQEYRENIELSLMSQQLQEKLNENAEDPTPEEVLESAKTYVTTYDGAKKSSHILFDASDEAQAQEVLEKLKAGDLDFATAAASYSKDTASAEQGGNVGWDKLNTNLAQEYTTALGDLKVNQISEIIPTTYGLEIIQCTEEFKAPKELKSLDELPVEFQESVTEIVKSSNASSAYYSWLEQQREGADIQTNDAPEGLPYWVDMNNYQKEESDSSGNLTMDENGNLVTADGQQVTVDEDGNMVTADGQPVTGAITAEGGEATAEGQEGGDQQASEQPAEGDQSAEGN